MNLQCVCVWNICKTSTVGFVSCMSCASVWPTIGLLSCLLKQGDHPCAVCDGPTKRPQYMRISRLITVTYLHIVFRYGKRLSQEPHPIHLFYTTWLPQSGRLLYFDFMDFSGIYIFCSMTGLLVLGFSSHQIALTILF